MADVEDSAQHMVSIPMPGIPRTTLLTSLVIFASINVTTVLRDNNNIDNNIDAKQA